MTDTLPRLAIIKVNSKSDTLVKIIHESGCLDSMYVDQNDLKDKLEKNFQKVDINNDPQMILSDDTINAVVIDGPSQDLFVFIETALQANKHVLATHLLFLDEPQIQHLIHQAISNELVLMAGNPAQYHPVFDTLSELVHGGQLGIIKYISLENFYQEYKDNAEYSLHLFSTSSAFMVMSLANETAPTIEHIENTHSYGSSFKRLTFPSGLQAHVHTSGISSKFKQEVVVIGDKKIAIFNDALPWDDKLIVSAVGQSDLNTPRSYQFAPAEPIELEYQRFIRAIGNKALTMTVNTETIKVRSMIAEYTSDKERTHADFTDCQIHPSAEVDKGVTIGPATTIWHLTHILSGSTIGSNCNIGQNVVIGPDVHVGNGCKIQNNVSLYPGVELEDNVFCGPSMVFTNVFNPRAEIPRKHEVRKTLVREGATLGGNCTIVCGYTIGRYAFVGAGAVVTKDVPNYALVFGNPARQAGWMCQCGEKLKDDLACSQCGKTYITKDDGTTLQPQEMHS